MRTLSDVEQFRAHLGDSLRAVFSNEDNLPLLAEVHRTYLYARLSNVCAEGGMLAGAPLHRGSYSRVLSNICTTFCTLQDGIESLNTLPEAYELPNNPSFETWLKSISDSIDVLVENDEYVYRIRHSFAWEIDYVNEGLFYAGLLEQYLLEGLRRYVGSWRIEDDLT